MEKVKIAFANGTELEAELNGSSYITDSKPDFPEDLSVVKITGDDYNQEMQYAKVVECYSVDGRYWFSFTETPEIERRLAEYEDALCELSMNV